MTARPTEPPDLLAARDDIRLIHHPTNQGYGIVLCSAFDFAVADRLRRSGHHRLRRPAPAATDSDVRRLAAGVADVDIVSGSRYLRRFPGHSDPPEARRRVNQIVTEELNRRLGLEFDRRILRFQGVSRVGVDEDRSEA